MARVDITDTLVEFDGKVRVEDAAARFPDDTVNNTVPRGWRVYQHTAVSVESVGSIENWHDVIDGVPYRWLPVSWHADRADAEAAATALLATL